MPPAGTSAATGRIGPSASRQGQCADMYVTGCRLHAADRIHYGVKKVKNIGKRILQPNKTRKPS